MVIDAGYGQCYEQYFDASENEELVEGKPNEAHANAKRAKFKHNKFGFGSTSIHP